VGIKNFNNLAVQKAVTAPEKYQKSSFTSIFLSDHIFFQKNKK
jgi:hypothetical protein